MITSYKNFEEVLEHEGKLIKYPTGTSMLPLLRQGKDVFLVQKPFRELRKNDVVLYKRKDKYILHRIIKINGENLVIIGDNCVTKEYDIKTKDVLGIMTHITRSNKNIDVEKSKSYKWYVRFLSVYRPAKKLYCLIMGIGSKIKRSIINQK